MIIFSITFKLFDHNFLSLLFTKGGDGHINKRSHLNLSDSSAKEETNSSSKDEDSTPESGVTCDSIATESHDEQSLSSPSDAATADENGADDIPLYDGASQLLRNFPGNFLALTQKHNLSS